MKVRHVFSILALAVATCLPSLAQTDQDVGNIAVIETDPTILQPGELFDLDNQTLTFTPKAGGGYTVSVGALEFDSNLGTNLGLGDFGTFQQNLSFTFQYFGVNRTSVFINSKGNLTFGSSSTLLHFNSGGSVTSLGSDVADILDRIASSPARIAVLWQDWNPSQGGGVFSNSQADRLIVTWQDVPLHNTATIATFQVILFSSGAIKMNYKSVTTTPGGGYLVGVSPGSSNDDARVTTINLSQGGNSISSFPTVEPLVQVFGTSSAPLVHMSAVARRFYASHGDLFDNIAVFANFQHGLGSAFAFLRFVRNNTSGIGLSTFNDSSFYGSSGTLQSILNMNRLECYPSDPNQTVTSGPCGGIGTNSTLDLMGQETGHQWLAFVQFDDNGVDSNLLLGRQDAHWSFFHDTDASDMEGNKWQDNDNGTFTTIEATSRFSDLDQYIMGLRPASEVPTFFFIRDPSPSNPCGTSASQGGRACAPQVGVNVSGTRQNVTVSQVIESEGARSPSSGFTGVNSTTTWDQAFILLIKSGTSAPQTDLDKIDKIRTDWISYFNTATDGRGSVNTTLPQPAISVTPGSLDFGNVNVGSSKDLNFTVQNSGGGTLTGSASTSSPYSIVAGASYSLGGGASQATTVRFSPTSAGTFMGSVTFTGGGGTTKTVTGTGGSTLTVSKAGTGSGTVTSSPTGISCGSDCSETYNSGTSVTITATPASGSVFAGWSGGGCSGTGSCTVTVNANTSVTATFDTSSQTFTLQTTIAGSASGTVTSSPAGINCGSDCSEVYAINTSVTLTATPASGASFKGWSGGGCSGTGTCTVLLNAAKSVKATFSKTYTDDPITSQSTVVKAVHVTDLRQAINTLRSNNSLSTFSFTDSTLTAGTTQIKAVHITELRSALSGVYTAKSLTQPTYTDPTITAGQTTAKKAHIAEIRQAIKDAE